MIKKGGKMKWKINPFSVKSSQRIAAGQQSAHRTNMLHPHLHN